MRDSKGRDDERLLGTRSPTRARRHRASGRSNRMSVGHLLRAIGDHFGPLINRPPLIVIGDRNIRRFFQPYSKESVRRNASISDRGNVRVSMTETIRQRATFQNEVCGKCWRQKVCQRSIVRRSAPMSRDSSQTRRGVAPCRMAAIKTTIALKYTFCPRKRTEGGVILFLQPSRSQQKLSLCRYVSGNSSWQPRGFRG